MNGSEQRESSVEARKEKIRKRYQSKNERIKVIPAKATATLYDETEEKRVAVYARVSTDNENQTSSYELQKSYYHDMVNKHSNWTLVDIYADEGISGTSLAHREAFMRMIDDCMAGKIDLIITKNVSRFARNIEDCIHYARQLKFCNPPVGILFETENIYTLNRDSEMALSFTATMAQEESHAKSESMNRSYHMRFERGLFMTPTLLGYDHDAEGNLVINEEEAKTVRLMFLMVLDGYKCSEIAEELMRLKRPTKVKKKSCEVNYAWSSSTVQAILRNERYCGDVLAQKTYTPNYLNHKSVKNRNNLPQYYEEDHHEAIISREDFITVQALLDQAKYGFRNALPELKVIDTGVLRGFVEINPCWVGFTEDDYLAACHSVLTDEDYLNPKVLIQKKRGDFELSKYQVTRNQFVSNSRKISVSITHNKIKFSVDAIAEFESTFYVEIFYHPLYEMLVVRKSDKNNRHAIKWSGHKNNSIKPRWIKASAFAPVLYALSGWNSDWRYTITGYSKEQNGEKVIMFYMDEPEIRVKQEDGKYNIFYPSEWRGEFGDYYDEHIGKTISIFDPKKVWNTEAQGVVRSNVDFQIRNPSEIKSELEILKNELGENHE